VTVPSPEATLLERRIHRSDLTALRADVRREALAFGLTRPRLGDFVLAVNEIVANALLHGGGSGRLRLWHDGDDLVCEIADSGPGFDHDRVGGPRPGPLAPGGRGLWLARTMVDALTISHRSTGTTVRLRVRCAAGPSGDL
jgi:anti-sigma regulatory factor (Ser/Thr protein kinase)